MLIQTALPWKSDANTQVLTDLGYTYVVTDFEGLASYNISDYKVVLIVNDQVQSFYDAYAANYSTFEQYVSGGGTLVFFACDNGWSSGNNYTDLPGGVQVEDDYATFNRIDSVAASHPIVTGSLRTGAPRTLLTDADLEGTAASHNYFIENTLPAGSDVIFRSVNNGAPTLVRYPLGKGHVIASGLTWEFTYDRYTQDGTTYGFGRALPDVFLYAIVSGGQNTAALNVYPDDNRALRNRPTTWKNPGDLLDIVASVDGSLQDDIANNQAFSLTFAIDPRFIDTAAPIQVYQRQDHASVADRTEVLISNAVFGTANGLTTVTLNDLNLGNTKGEWLVRVKLDDTAPRVVGAEVRLNVAGKTFLDTLGKRGAVAATRGAKLFLTNRAALYAAYVAAGGRDETNVTAMATLWQDVYREADRVRASVLFVDKFDLGFDGETGNSIIGWPTDRTHLPYDADTATNAEEDEVNGVANRVAEYLAERVAASGGIGEGRDVAILGGDAVIPFYRSYDTTSLHDTTTVLDTAKLFESHPIFYATSVFRTDGENGYLHTDGHYRALDVGSNQDWKAGVVSAVSIGRLAGPSSGTLSHLINSSARQESISNRVVLLENWARDEELRDFENQAVDAKFNVVTSVNGVTLDKEPAVCPWWKLDLCSEQDDDANWATLDALFTGNADGVTDFDIWRGMTHGTVRSISSSLMSEYLSSQNLESVADPISRHFATFDPFFIFDACLVGQVDGYGKLGLLNSLLDLNVGGVAASSVVTYSSLPGNISDYNSQATGELFKGSTIGAAFLAAYRGFSVDGNLDDLHRQAVNLFGLPWARLTTPKARAPAQFAKTEATQRASVFQAADDVLAKSIPFSASVFNVEHDAGTGFDFVTVDGFNPQLRDSATPVMVYGSQTLALPPDAEIVSVRLVAVATQDLGRLKLPGFERGLGLPIPGSSLGSFVTLRNPSGIYPRDVAPYAVADLGQTKLLNVIYYPMTYDAGTDATTLVTQGELIVEYRTAYVGTADYLVTDEARYVVGHPINATVSVTNVTTIAATFTLRSTLFDLEGNPFSSNQNLASVAGGASGTIDVVLATPIQAGMYKLESVISDGAGSEIGRFVKDIFVVGGAIGALGAQDRFLKDQEGWFTVNFENYRDSEVEFFVDIDIFSVDGGLAVQIPQLKVSAGAQAESVIQVPWIPSETLTDGRYYAVATIREGTERFTRYSDSFAVHGSLFASAGEDQSVVEGYTVTLDGTGSYSETGTLLLNWELLAGPNGDDVVLDDPGVADPTFTAPTLVGDDSIDLMFRLTVSDGTGLERSDDVKISVTEALVPIPIYTVTVDQGGTGSGTLGGSGKFASGTPVTLTATAGTGSIFTGWSPIPCDNQFAMPAYDLTCTANFTLNRYLVTAVAGANGGISPMSQTVDYGATAGFILAPKVGYGALVTGCGGSLVGNTYTTAPIFDTCAVNASFARALPLTVLMVGTGSGTVTGPGIDCGGDCRESLALGTSVTLRAVPAPDSIFAGWYRACSGTGDCNLTMARYPASNRPIARFRLKTYAITATANPVAGGTVSCHPNPVAHGGKSTCNAIPKSGYAFVGFSGACSGASCVLSHLNSNQAVIANFSPKTR
ncbi:InlB B-repeat-containing protein [Lamprocystis purpurea]|uniref:InlB B-repeat-containing protein n=1 Tax=Lamprocystis purpurea TaxID=61598 RepID=UPI0012FA43E7|nr:hypothetical protein [Lamprocystis purpurea]